MLSKTQSPAPCSPVWKSRNPASKSSTEGRWVRQPPVRTWWLPLTLEQVDILWQEFEAQWATRWGAVRLVAETAGHFVHKDQPDLVPAVVHEVLAAIDDGREPRITAERARELGSRLMT